MQMPLDDRHGPAPRLAREQATALVGAALLEYDRVIAASQPHAANGGRRMPRTAATWATAAGAIVALTVGAAAARYYLHSSEPARPVQAPPAPAAPIEHEHKLQPEAPAAEPSAPEHLDTSTPSTTSAPSTAPTTLIKRANATERNASDDLLQKANHQRAVAQFREAAATYAQVYEHFPRTQSAYAARVADAAIELEHLANPTRARRLFEQALRDEPHGSLDLEARQGLCLALRDLEDRGAEARALHALINAHPDSPAARRAQVRLRELGDNAE
jgi:hypothetical protein